MEIFLQVPSGVESSSGLSDTGAAVLAGLIAGLIMLVPIYLGLVMMPRQMKMDLLKLLGTMVMPINGGTYPVGLMIHLAMSIVFAVIHVLVFDLFDITSSYAVWGILFGFAHALISGTGIGMLEIVHRGIKDGTVQAPGFMTLNYPAPTTSGFVIVHVLFGVLVGAFYGAFI